ncbi:MAG: polyphenol oxidase family protein [Coriobacteriales bacterium]|nr:polyphenol oxidase family protein [Coriobacteriales bacterium]
MLAISEDFTLFEPHALRLPWLVAFTTAARRGEERFDFTAEVGQEQRRALERALAPLALTWLTLEHGSRVVTIGEPSVQPGVQPGLSPVCDGALIIHPGTAAAFTTADCLPVVIATTGRTHAAAAIHAGWRSLAAGIIEDAVERLARASGAQPPGFGAWIGPAIAREDYEVGSEVAERLLVRPAITEEQFTPVDAGHFLADLPGAATAILVSCGVPAEAIEHYPVSTKQSPLLHSVRRDGSAAGRMATVVGIRNEVR